VGAFEGAAYQLFGMFRPKQDCRMRTLGVSFCPICKEAHVLRIFHYLRLVDTANPPLGPADVPALGSRTFTVTPVNLSGLSYRWNLAGAVIANATNASVAIAGSQINGTNVELRLEVTHTTPLVRAQTIVQSNFWSLRTAPSPTISIGDAAVLEANIGTTNLVFPVRLSFAHPNPVSVQYATSNGTATAGSDYVAKTGTLTFAPNQTSNAITVTVNGDSIAEPNEVLFVNLSNPTNANLADRQATGVIIDDDSPPSVVFSSPLEGTLFPAPANLDLVANGSDIGGTVTKIQFFEGPTQLGQSTNSQYSITWSNVPAGHYVLTAVATDNSGRTGTSAPVNVLVVSGSVQSFAPILIDPTQPADRIVRQGRSTTLTVAATAAPAPAYQWFRDGAPIAGATGPSYTIFSMTSGTAGSYFARITNLVGSVDSRTATLGYESDREPPTLIYALGSANPVRITVSFSEPINGTTGGNIANYRVATLSGGADLTISSAAGSAGTNVILTTSARSPGVNYFLTVNNVRDLFNNVIAPNSRIPIASEVVFVAADNQVWRYFQSDADPGLGWTALGYDDSYGLWASGLALFDAKRPAGRTTVGPNSDPVRTMLNLTNPPTANAQTLAYYFRTTFVVPSRSAGMRLRLRTLVDDGAVYYLNGQEVYRLRMASPPMLLAYTNLAVATQSDNQNVYEGPFALSADALRDGENVLAVEVHQADATSSDVSFAAQLSAELPGLPLPALTIARSGDSVVLTWTPGDAVLQSAELVSGPWSDVLPTPPNPYRVLSGETAKFYRLRSDP
jgi:hypothetical protein